MSPSSPTAHRVARTPDRTTSPWPPTLDLEAMSPPAPGRACEHRANCCLGVNLAAIFVCGCPRPSPVACVLGNGPRWCSLTHTWTCRGACARFVLRAVYPLFAVGTYPGPDVLALFGEQGGLVMTETVLMGEARVARVPVVECGENLVDVRCVEGLALTDCRADPYGAYSRLRRGAVHRLLEAQAYLPQQYRLLVVEGFRRFEVQQRHFDACQRRVEFTIPTLVGPGSRRIAGHRVSPPALAPHVSGRAVDLTLADQSRRPLDLGTGLDATLEGSAGACVFDAPNISRQARRHRELLKTVLTRVGFVNHPTEWWHWSFGDRYWAYHATELAAMYGPIEGGAAQTRGAS